ncbi:hypothetical protein HZS55_01505 [Halosimplex rubrum]|uniref:Uncharacterized protein n=1 Tax=Halosimplex rubrum TaxID=869889 RepID=A0A7D5P818_9EURY|nr:hypothetical protein [Halosimplex rubrum]QLH76059.1 hypothetical protein HZS55_01505 [Halosimplex rubrum]
MAAPDAISSNHAVEVTTAVAGTIRRSLSLKLAIAGLCFVLSGFLLQTGVYAALLPIWGIGLLSVGTVSYALIRRTRR